MGKFRDSLKQKIDEMEKELVAHATSLGVGFAMDQRAKDNLLRDLLERKSEAEKLLTDFRDDFKNSLNTMAIHRAASSPVPPTKH